MKASRFIARPVPSRCGIQPGAAFSVLAARSRRLQPEQRRLPETTRVPGSYAQKTKREPLLPVTATCPASGARAGAARSTPGPARREGMLRRAPCPRQPWSCPNPPDQALCFPRAGGSGSHAPCAARALKGTDGSPPGPGTLLFVPKGIPTATTTICSLQSLGSSATAAPTGPCPSQSHPNKMSLGPAPPRSGGRGVPRIPAGFQLRCLQLSCRRNTCSSSCSLPITPRADAQKRGRQQRPSVLELLLAADLLMHFLAKG